MNVRFSAEVENEKLQERFKNRATSKWEHYRSDNLVRTLHKARDMGWINNEVQVRVEPLANGEVDYVIEPFEDCGCGNILRFSDYFLRPEDEEHVG